MDIKKPLYSKERGMALMLYVLKETAMRVGKEIYAKENRSYGLTSLRKKHARIMDGNIVLNFKGKSNQRLTYVIKQDTIVKEIKILLKLAGDKIFQYVSNDKVYRIKDRDLNEYLKTYTNKEFVIKDFRTYAANYYFVK